ncbi:MAG: hypothetical protein V4592_25415 [Bacteroidota bacterium]
MKMMFKTALFAASLFAAGQSIAQTTPKDSSLGHKISKSAKKVGNATAKTATQVGHKTSELAAKGAAVVVDKKYDGMVAPGGQTVYINSHSQYYYVNTKGHRVYLKKSQLVNKP